MSTLHVVSHSPFTDSRLDSCLRVCGSDDAILLCGDGAYGLRHPALLTIGVMVFVMALAANLIEGAFSSPEAFLKWSFVVMALPGFILHYLDAISDEPETDWKTTENGRKLYRAGGVVIFILMVLVVMGIDIASWLVG